MDSYGVWDLVYRYLLPDWWIIPVYLTVTAWIATITWWRRAIRQGLTWAQRASIVLADAPTVRRYALRLAIALPLFAIPAVVLGMWYLIGCVLATWGDTVSLDPTMWSAVTVGYGLIGIIVSVWALNEEDGVALAVVAFWFSVVISAPLILLGALSLGIGLLMGLFPDTPVESQAVMIGGMLLLAGIMPFVGFCAAGWASQRGIELITGVGAYQDWPVGS